MTKKQSGMSLVEVLVSLAILGVVTAALTTSMTQMMSAQKTIEARQNITSFVNDVQTLVTNGSTCLNLLGGGSQVFDYNASRGTLGDAITVRLNDENVTNGFDSNRYNIRVSRLYLTNGTAVGSDGSLSVFKAQVVGEFQPLSGLANIGGLSDFRARTMATIFLSTNASNNIVACQNQSPLEVSLVSDFCESFGGTYNVTTQKCDGLITTAQICTAIGGTMRNGICTPPGGGVSSGSPESGTWRYINQTGNYCSSITRELGDRQYNGACSPTGRVSSYNYTGAFPSLVCTVNYQCQ